MRGTRDQGWSARAYGFEHGQLATAAVAPVGVAGKGQRLCLPEPGAVGRLTGVAARVRCRGGRPPRRTGRPRTPPGRRRAEATAINAGRAQSLGSAADSSATVSAASSCRPSREKDQRSGRQAAVVDRRHVAGSSTTARSASSRAPSMSPTQVRAQVAWVRIAHARSGQPGRPSPAAQRRVRSRPSGRELTAADQALHPDLGDVGGRTGVRPRRQELLASGQQAPRTLSPLARHRVAPRQPEQALDAQLAVGASAKQTPGAVSVGPPRGFRVADQPSGIDDLVGSRRPLSSSSGRSASARSHADSISWTRPDQARASSSSSQSCPFLGSRAVARVRNSVAWTEGADRPRLDRG